MIPSSYYWTPPYINVYLYTHVLAVVASDAVTWQLIIEALPILALAYSI
jgi:hypothetical protein